MISLIITTIFDILNYLITIILLPIDNLISQLLPSIDNGLSSIAYVFDYLSNVIGYVIDMSGLSSTAIQMIIIYYTFSIGITVAVSSIKFVLNWYKTLKG